MSLVTHSHCMRLGRICKFSCKFLARCVSVGNSCLLEWMVLHKSRLILLYISENTWNSKLLVMSCVLILSYLNILSFISKLILLCYKILAEKFKSWNTHWICPCFENYYGNFMSSDSWNIFLFYIVQNIFRQICEFLMKDTFQLPSNFWINAGSSC